MIKLEKKEVEGYKIVELEEAEYLLGEEGMLYDVNEHELIGKWKKEEKEIEYRK